MALLQDGAFGQINALMNRQILGGLGSSEIAAQKIVLGKYAGGCSTTQSANDKGRQHHHLKRNFLSSHFKYDAYADPPGRAWTQLKDLLKASLAPTSFETVWKCLCHSDLFLDKSFSASNCRDSFSSAGVYDAMLKGPNYPRILSSNPHFASLTQEDAQTVLDVVPNIVDTTMDIGFVPEFNYDTMFAEFPHVDNCPPKPNGMALNAMCVSRQRACVLTNPTFNEIRHMVSEDALAATNNKHWNRQRVATLKEIEEKRKADEKALHPGRAKKYKCSNPLCAVLADTTNKQSVFAAWTHCSNPKCVFVFCTEVACKQMCENHSARCGHK